MCKCLMISLVLVAMSALPVAAETVVYQQGTDGYTGCQDAYGWQLMGDVNNGGDQLLWAAIQNGGLYASTIRYDVSSLEGQYSSIDSVTLRLYCTSVYYPSNTMKLSAYPEVAGNQYWVEGTKKLSTEVGSSCFNYQQYDTLLWAGGSTGGTASDDVYWRNTYPAVVGTPYAWIDISIDPTTADTGYGTGGITTLTGLIDEWITEGAANAGIGFTYNCIYGVDPNQRWSFASSEYGTQRFRPELVIEYTPIPEPSTLALLAGGLIGLAAYAWRKRKS